MRGLRHVPSSRAGEGCLDGGRAAGRESVEARQQLKGPWALMAAALLAGALAGCGGGKQDSLARIRQAGVLKWGADPSGGAPFAFFNPKEPEEVIGFEVDMMECVGKHLGLKTEIVRADWDTLIDVLKRGDCDVVVNGIEINPEREKEVLFSAPYYEYEQQLAVRVADSTRYTSLDSLKGKKIATLVAAESNNVLKRAGWSDDLIQPMKDSQQPYDELKLGRVEAVLQEDIIGAYYVKNYPELCMVPKGFEPGRYAMALRKEDKELAAELDRIVSRMKENGELAAIYIKWNILTPRQTALGVKVK
jgi:polar amino acid transport system substrate-binding protein